MERPDRVKPTIFVGECLPQKRVRAVFEARAYRVYGVGEAFPSGAPDLAILAAADAADAIVISTDRDRRRLLKNVGQGHLGRYRRAGRILFNCDHSVALARLEALFDDIERECQLASATGRQLIMRITGGAFTVER